MPVWMDLSVDLKRLSEEPFVEVIVSRNNLIIQFANRAADAPPTSNRPVQFSILYLLTTHATFLFLFPLLFLISLAGVFIVM